MNSSDTRKQIKSTSILVIFSFLSPITGMLLEMVLAYKFGISPLMDAFRSTAIILVFGKQIFIGTLMPNVIIPIFAQYFRKKQLEDGLRFVFTYCFILFIGTLIIVGAVVSNPGKLLNLIGPGLSGDAKVIAIIFIKYFTLSACITLWSGILSGVLQVFKVFWVGASTQIINNLVIVVAVLFVGAESEPHSIAYGVLFGGLLSMLLHIIIFLSNTNVKEFHFSTYCSFCDKDVLFNSLLTFVPLIILTIFSQLSGIVLSRQLSFLPTGALSMYGLAAKPMIILGLLSGSYQTVLFPYLATKWSKETRGMFVRSISKNLDLFLLLSFPLAFFLWDTRFEVIRLFFLRGKIVESDITNIASIFGILLIGGPILILLNFLYKVCFASENHRIPTYCSGFSLLIYVLFISTVREAYGIVGIAYLQNLNALFSVIICFVLLYLKDSLFVPQRVMKSVFIQLLCGSTALAIAYLLRLCFSFMSLSTSDLYFFIASVLAFFITYITYLSIMHNRKMKQYVEILFNKYTKLSDNSSRS